MYSRKSKEPDIDTLSYWVGRLEPIIRAEDVGEVIVVLANRCGTEEEAIYAGTSCVLGIEDGEVKVYGILGRGERELLVVDTTDPPQFKLVAEPNAVIAEDTMQSRNAPAVLNPERSSRRDTRADTPYPSDTQPQGREGLLASIDAVLAEVTAVSPVNSTASHAFFSPERPHSEERLGKVRSSIPASESQSPSTSISSSIHSPVPILKDPTPPRAGTPRTGRSSRTRASERPSERTSDRQSDRPPVPAKKPLEMLQITPVNDWDIEHEDQPLDSASSMKVNTPWEQSPAIFRAEEIIKIMKAPTPSPPIINSSRHASPPIPPLIPQKPRSSSSSSSQASPSVIPIANSSRQESPPIVPILGSNNAIPIVSSSRHASPPSAPSFIPPTERPQSPKSRNTSRSRTEHRQPALISQDLINEPAIAPIIALVEEIERGASRDPTADPSTQPSTQVGLTAHDDRSMSLRPRSIGW